MDFNIFDVVVIAITLILAIKGFFSGIIREISGLIGIGLGVFVSTNYYKEAGEFLNLHVLQIQNTSAINTIGFITLFVSIWIIMILIGLIISKLLDFSSLGFVNRLGGLFFGAGKFFVLVSILSTMLFQIEFIQNKFGKYKEKSIVWPYMKKVGDTLVHLKPEELKEKVDKVVDSKVSKVIKEKVENAKEDLNKVIKGD